MWRWVRRSPSISRLRNLDSLLLSGCGCYSTRSLLMAIRIGFITVDRRELELLGLRLVFSCCCTYTSPLKCRWIFNNGGNRPQDLKLSNSYLCSCREASRSQCLVGGFRGGWRTAGWASAAVELNSWENGPWKRRIFEFAKVLVLSGFPKLFFFYPQTLYLVLTISRLLRFQGKMNTFEKSAWKIWLALDYWEEIEFILYNCFELK